MKTETLAASLTAAFGERLGATTAAASLESTLIG